MQLEKGFMHMARTEKGKENKSQSNEKEAAAPKGQEDKSKQPREHAS